ncbi:MAG: hypothetical protein N3B11_02980, partial [Coriobacteriia bacterium]|nr:hypothetical protein [Coriobacteriia bacterium]
VQAVGAALHQMQLGLLTQRAVLLLDLPLRQAARQRPFALVEPPVEARHSKFPGGRIARERPESVFEGFPIFDEPVLGEEARCFAQTPSATAQPATLAASQTPLLGRSGGVRALAPNCLERTYAKPNESDGIVLLV